MIDYGKIAYSVNYYRFFQYEPIEVPWLISQEAMDITRPKGTKLFSTFAGNLVASGEQSLLEIRDKLELGKKYQCVTPCFRDEDFNELHKMWFIKNELMLVGEYGEKELFEMIHEATGFFKNYSEPKVVKTDIGYDIEINGIEVGSYGLRSHEDFHWVYGTGCAEPRLSQAIA